MCEEICDTHSSKIEGQECTATAVFKLVPLALIASVFVVPAAMVVGLGGAAAISAASAKVIARIPLRVAVDRNSKWSSAFKATAGCALARGNCTTTARIAVLAPVPALLC